MTNNLFIGKNSFICKSIFPSVRGKYISHKEIKDVNFKKYKNIFLLSSPKNYKKENIKNFIFEKKILNKITNQRLIFFSTSKIYPNKLNCTENIKPNPQSFYAENKLKAEKLFGKEIDKILILRLSNIFEIKNRNKDTFLGMLHNNFFKKNKIEFDINTNSVRDLFSIKSLISLITKIEKNEILGIYNIGSEKGYKIKDIIKFYFGEKLISSKKIIEKNKIKSQTLCVKKLKKLIDLSKYDFHKETKSQLEKCKKYFF
jgi:dTDP-4-dehydrorhamnose reductase